MTTPTRLSHTDETTLSPDDRKFARSWNFALAACERKVGDGLVWRQEGRSWGALVAASYGGHVCYGASPSEAMAAYLSM